jgi:hypothetical protein
MLKEMGDTLQRVRELVRAGMVKISEHGYDELAADGISARERRPCRLGHPREWAFSGRSDHRISAWPATLGSRLFQADEMTTRKRTKIVREGKYVAEVDVELLEDETGWSPNFSLDDAYKLDDVREALRRGDITAASRASRVFSLTPVSWSVTQAQDEQDNHT